MVGADSAAVGTKRLMSVLIFAPPQPELSLQQREVATMINAFERPLLAHTEDELRHCIERADKIEGFWFIGHSGPSGIVANGQTMTPAVIGQYLSVAGVQWSYFSSCESAAFIRNLQAVYAHDCYAYIVDVFDAAAWRNAALIAAKYANVRDIHEAVRVGAPANSADLRFFPSVTNRGRKVMREERIDDLLVGQMQDLTKAIYALQNEIALSEQRTKMEIALLTKRVEQIERDGDAGKPIMSDYQVNRIIAILVVIAMLIGYAVYLLLLRG